MEPQITNNELLKKMLKGFADLGERLGIVEKSVKSLEEGQQDVLEAVNNGFQDMEERFDKRFTTVENKLDGLDNRVDKLDTKVTSLVDVLHNKGAITSQEKERVML